MALQKLVRLYHTLRYLRLKQIIFRVYYRFAQVRVHIYRNVAVRRWRRDWSAPSWRNLSTNDAVEFTFLGITGNVQCPEDWQADRSSKLWLYNLHYLDDLNARDIGSQPGLADKLIQSWIQANPPVSGEGWEPYPLSLRIVNLVKWLARHDERSTFLADSLAVQADALVQQVEYHILGNHLFANGKALVFAGAYLSGAMADRWLAKGLRILDEELPEQFLNDGGHFELSPMYHATLLWDMCDLVNLSTRSGLPDLAERLPQWREVVVQGLKWLRSMQHPDGRISFFNDAAFGIAPEYEDIAAYAKRLDISPPAHENHLAAIYNSATGYAAVLPADGVKAILDLAKVGPDYQPGHAHADTLSFELSVFGKRLVVNSGTSQYGDDAERQRQRGTAAHNTVGLLGYDSSEVWAGFRVARRAAVVIERFEVEPEITCIQASHDGYGRLVKGLRHRRTWTFTRTSMEIFDSITGDQVVATSRFFFSPEVKVSMKADGFVADMGAGKKVSINFSGSDDVRLISSTWHPEFGCSLANQCLVATFSGDSLTTRICWGGI